MRTKNLLFIICGLIAAFNLVGCGDDDPVDGGNDGVTVVTDTLQKSTGEKNVEVRPGSNNTIYLKGYYYVNAGTKLTIPAGTIVIGLPESVAGTPSAIITLRGTTDKASGQLIADGTAAKPIVFTSSRPVGQRARADWGGIELLGLADVNLQSKAGIAEGVGGDYGYGGVLSGPKNDDNSGIMRYVRIEFGGTKVTPDNEINGLTLSAVGSGTTLEYIQSHMIADDGFEWFGGTVNAKHLVSSGNDDDAFDMDYGYSGNVQFLFAMQDPTLANRGFEVDNDAAGSSLTPFTSATVANVTLVGTGQDQANNEKNDGFYLRRNNKLKIWNAICTNFRQAVVIDGAGTHQNVANDELSIKQSILNGRSKTYGKASGDTTSASAGYESKAASWGNIEEDPQLAGIDFANPQPKPGNAKAANVGPVPNNGFFTANNYAGAFDPASSSYWFSGWTIWVKN